jgi:hypothetical protein
VGPVQIPQKARQDTLCQSCVLHLVAFVDHVVHYGASGAQNVYALFFLLGWDQYRFKNKRVETRYAKIVFLHPVGYVGHVVYFSASGRETSTHYFSFSCGTDMDSTKNVSGHLMPNLCFFIRWYLRVT